MRRLWVITLAAGALLALSPSQGMAAACGDKNNLPPGNSEADQYVETVPNECGEGPVATPSDDDPSAVPASTASELEGLGADGQAALALANSEATGPAAGSGNGGQGAGGNNQEIVSDDDGGLGDVFGSVADAFGGSSGAGMGLILPLLLVAATLAGAVYLLRRRNAG